MTDWTNDKIIRLWLEILDELGVKPDEASGAALWVVFSNNERVLDVDRMVVDVGSWRHAGGMIASICGGDYLSFYMSNYRADEALVLNIRMALGHRGFVLADWDEWKAGVVDGRYPCPDRWKEYFNRGAR